MMLPVASRKIGFFTEEVFSSRVMWGLDRGWLIAL